jgi:hypothetical protein
MKATVKSQAKLTSQLTAQNHQKPHFGVIATFHQNFNSLGQEITKMIFSRHFEVSQDWAIETYHKTPL